MILNPKDDTVTVRTEKKIKRKRNTCEGKVVCIQIVTEPKDIKYRVCFTKRRNLNGNTSIPFGYIKE
jgi:hypothetical protein